MAYTYIGNIRHAPTGRHMMTQIFISYARKDGRNLALQLQTDLQTDGYDVWLDTSDIDTGL